MSHLTIYAPENMDNPRMAGLALGSALVGVTDADGGTMIYYEGNIYGACNLHDFDERVLVAAARLQDKAPTIARIYLPKEVVDEHFVEIGYFDGEIRGQWSIKYTDKTRRDVWASRYSGDS